MQDSFGASRASQVSTGILTFLSTAYFRRTGLPSGGAWLSELAATLLLLPIAWAFDRFLRRHAGQSFPDILRQKLRPVFFVPLLCLFSLFLFAATAYTVWEFSVFVRTNILYHTTPFLITAVLLGSALSLALSGSGSVLRCCGLLFPGVLLLTATLQGFSLTYLEPSNFCIGLEDPKGLILFGFQTFLPSLFLLPALASVFGTVPAPSKAPCSMVLSVFFGGIVTTLAFLADELVLSPTVVAMLDFPTYARSSCIGLGDFFQHIEILSAFLFQLSAIIVAALTILWFKALFSPKTRPLDKPNRKRYTDRIP